MFVEMPTKMVNKLKNILKNMNIKFETSDCTLKGDKENVSHIEFITELTEEQIETINNEIDYIYDSDRQDIDKNNEPKEYRHRKWDDKTHGPIESMQGYFSGEIEKEDVIYE